MSYRYIEGVTVADVAFEAEGASLNELFESAGLAVTNTMIKELADLKTEEKRTIKLENDNLEKLLHDFLHEIVFLKDRDLMLFSKIKVDIEKDPTYRLFAQLEGETINTDIHEMLVDVKAVTWHLFNVAKKGNKWTCHVVLDV